VEGLIQQQPPDRSEPGVSSRRADLHPVSADHRDDDIVEDALLAGPGQEGNDVPPGSGPGAEPLVEIALGAFTQVPSAAVQPRQVALAAARSRTIVNRLTCVSARPTEIPQVRAAAAYPTGSPQTKRHSPAHGGTPAKVALSARDEHLCRSSGLTGMCNSRSLRAVQTSC